MPEMQQPVESQRLLESATRRPRRPRCPDCNSTLFLTGMISLSSLCLSFVFLQFAFHNDDPYSSPDSDINKFFLGLSIMLGITGICATTFSAHQCYTFFQGNNLDSETPPDPNSNSGRLSALSDKIKSCKDLDSDLFKLLNEKKCTYKDKRYQSWHDTLTKGTCSISHDLANHPIILDNQTYDQTGIKKWLQEENTVPHNRRALKTSEINTINQAPINEALDKKIKDCLSELEKEMEKFENTRSYQGPALGLD